MAGIVYVNRPYEEQAITQKSNDIQNISRTSEVIQLSQVPLMQTGDRTEIKGYLTEWRSRLAFIYDSLYFLQMEGSYWKSSVQRGALAAVIPVGVIDRMLGFFTFSEFDLYMLVDQFVIFFLVVVAILLLVSYTTTSRIVRPIFRLTEGVERIMSGDYRQHIHIDTSDEMKTLAGSFNRLSDRMIQIRTDDRFIFLGHFAARMAHEMRKPLHIIRLAALAVSYFSITFLASLSLAIFINEISFGAQAFQVIFYLPMIIPMSLAGITWAWLLSPINGFTNTVIRAITENPRFMFDWYQEPKTALIGLVRVVTEGGPGIRTYTLYYYSWKLAFERQDRGQASQVAYITAVIIIILAVVLNRVFRPETAERA